MPGGSRRDATVWKRTILETSLDAVIAINAAGLVVEWSRAAERIFGWSAAEALGRELAGLVMPDRLREAHRGGLRRLVDAGGATLLGRRVEMTALRRDGSEFPVELTVDRLPLEGGTFFAGYVRDISDRKQADEALAEANAVFEKAQEVAHVGSWVSDPDQSGRLRWSREVYRIFGLDEGSFDGRVETFFARVHHEDLESVRRASAAALEGRELYSIDHRIVRPDGAVRWVHERADVVRDASGLPVRMIGIVQDITERVKLENQLRQAQKMEAVGRLAGGLAHDFNNLLAVVSGHTSLALRQLESGHPARARLEQVLNAVDRAASLTRQLLAFSRRQVLQAEVLDLGEVVADLSKMLHRVISEDVTFIPVLKAGPASVRVDRGQFEQALLNLVVNARDAMPSGGTLVVEVDGVELDEAAVRGRLDIAPGSYVVVAVSDTGTGMDAETLSHIFEPFFTTKEAGRGTGLGLAMVYGFVKQSGGHITVYSERGHGTTFKLYLPRAIDQAPEPRSAAPAPAPACGSETILLVEDERMLRGILRETLEGFGYRVLEAINGEEALGLSEGHAGAIHLLVTDVVMPAMGGVELAARLAASRYGMRVLYISGYTGDAALHAAFLPAGATFLQKPFTPDALGAKVRELLELAD